MLKSAELKSVLSYGYWQSKLLKNQVRILEISVLDIDQFKVDDIAG